VAGDKLRHRFLAEIKTAIPGGTSAGDDFLIHAGVALQVGCLSAKSARMGNLAAQTHCAEVKFASPLEAVTEAVRRLENEEAMDYINPKPMTNEEASQVYALDVEWENVERSLAGRVKPEV
jgi:hypothetical protein